WSKVFGFQNAVTKTALRKDHVFHMASVTKLLVGTCVLKLCDEKKLNLDETLTSYLPDFEMADPRYTEITLRQLLSHTSGMPDVTDYHWDKAEVDADALRRYVYSDEVQKARLLWAPSENKFSYSNIAYEILGYLISIVSGQSFEEYVAAAIFLPLNMKGSTLLTFERDMKNVACPHEKDADHHFFVLPIFPYHRAHAPSSTLTATLSDLSLLARAFLSKELLSAKMWAEALTPNAVVPNNGEQICLSWFCREQNGHTLFGHEGTDDGFRSSFWICPELDLSIIVCSNLSMAPVKKISKQIFDLLCV
ncbi:MAG: serine hydrolase, partial [Eubacteriales bacterium]|nr:serine hydrolase [Eubacteriales bacterium]